MDPAPLLFQATLDTSDGSRVYVAENEERVRAMFGSSPISCYPGCASVWFVSEPINSKVDIRAFVENFETVFAQLTQGYQAVTNVIDARNTLHIRWLKRAGFSFVRFIPEHGPESRPFYEFVKVI